MADFKSKFGLGDKVHVIRKQKRGYIGGEIYGVISSAWFSATSIIYQVEYYPGDGNKHTSSYEEKELEYDTTKGSGQ